MASSLHLRLLAAAAATLALAAPARAELVGEEVCEADEGCDELSALQARGLDVRSAGKQAGWTPPQAMVQLQISLGPMPTTIGCVVSELDTTTSSDLRQLGAAARVALHGDGVQQEPSEPDSLAQQQPQAVQSSFGAGAGGESWQVGMAVAYLDPVGGLNANGTTVTLSLGLTSSDASWTLETGVITVAGLPAMLPQTMDWKASSPPGEPVGCPPAYCKMPAPVGGSIYVPNCGFAPVMHNVTQPAPQPGEDATLSFDITSLVAANYTVFQVSTSTVSDSEGFWQSPQYTVTSLGFSAITL